MANLIYTDSPSNDGNNLGLGAGATEGNDKIIVTAISDGVSPSTANLNFLGGYGGNDSLTIEVKSRFDIGVDVETNRFAGGDGNDKLFLKASTKDGNIDVFMNTFTGGDGKDQIKLLVKGDDDVDISQNSIQGSYGDNQILIDAKRKGLGDLSIAGNDISTSGDRDRITLKGSGKGGSSVDTIANNSIVAGDGQNQIQLGLTSSADAIIVGNSLDSGGDKDKITVTAKSSSRVDLLTNSVTSGDGDDTIKLQAQSKSGAILFLANQIGVYGGDDRVDLIAKNTGIVGTYMSENVLVNVSGELDLKAQSISKGNASFDENTLLGAGEQSLDIRVKAKGTSYADSNLISLGGAYHDISIRSEGETSNADFNEINVDNYSTVEITSKAKGNADTNGNSITSAGDENELAIKSQGETTYIGSNVITDFKDTTISAKAKGNAYLGYNDLEATLAFSTTEIQVDAKGDASVIGNTLEMGLISRNELQVQAKGTATVENNEILIGKYLDFIVDAKSSGSVIENNLFFSSAGTSDLTLDLDTGLGTGEIETFLENNSIDGGVDPYSGRSDILSWDNKNQEVDFDTISAQGRLLNIEQIHLGRRSDVTIDYDDVVAITESDNELFIAGKGSTVDIGAGWTNAGSSVYGESIGTTLFTQGTANLHIENGTTIVYA